jgi:hypothetical protein
MCGLDGVVWPAPFVLPQCHPYVGLRDAALPGDITMNLESLALLFVLGAVNNQISHIVTVGVIFEDVRQLVKVRIGGKMAHLVTCHLCCGQCRPRGVRRSPHGSRLQ